MLLVLLKFASVDLKKQLPIAQFSNGNFINLIYDFVAVTCNLPLLTYFTCLLTFTYSLYLLTSFTYLLNLLTFTLSLNLLTSFTNLTYLLTNLYLITYLYLLTFTHSLYLLTSFTYLFLFTFTYLIYLLPILHLPLAIFCLFSPVICI